MNHLELVRALSRLNNHYHYTHSTTTPNSMGEGLTRRRGGGGGNGGDGSPGLGSSDQLPSHNNTNTSSSSSAGNANKKPVVAPSASGGKVAYDPRDFQDDSEANKMPRLTLMEEVLLLGLKDKAVSTTSRTRLSSFAQYNAVIPTLTLTLRATCRSGTTTSRTRSADVF